MLAGLRLLVAPPPRGGGVRSSVGGRRGRGLSARSAARGRWWPWGVVRWFHGRASASVDSPSVSGASSVGVLMGQIWHRIGSSERGTAGVSTPRDGTYAA